MKTKTIYVTNDNEEHKSIDDAESHDYYRAESALKLLFYSACPYLENTHKVVQDMLSYPTALTTFKYLYTVLTDALPPETGGRDDED